MEYTECAATISECGLYRYDLIRSWRHGNGERCLFIMLNPSTADGSKDDPTIKRCVSFADSWGYSGITVVNLFALRATNPQELYRYTDPVGKENNAYIKRWADVSDKIIAAWGNHGTHQGRNGQVVAMLQSAYRHLHCLKKTGGNHPGHPLYIAAAAQLIPYP